MESQNNFNGAILAASTDMDNNILSDILAAKAKAEKPNKLSSVNMIGSRVVLTDQKGTRYKFKDYYTTVLYINKTQTSVDVTAMPKFFSNLIQPHLVIER